MVFGVFGGCIASLRSEWRVGFWSADCFASFAMTNMRFWRLDCFASFAMTKGKNSSLRAELREAWQTRLKSYKYDKKLSKIFGNWIASSLCSSQWRVGFWSADCFASFAMTNMRLRRIDCFGFLRNPHKDKENGNN